MKTNGISQAPGTAHRERRIAGRAQDDHVQDPYQAGKKPHDGTACPQCGVVYHEGRWQWGSRREGAPEELCAACRRTNEHFPAGIVMLRGAFALRHKAEIEQLARHQEVAEKDEHPLNRIIDIAEDAHGITINTTDIHLPRRIGEAVERAFHGELAMHYDEDGYFVRVSWTPPAG